MHPEKAAMWLQATWAAAPERLLTVTKVQVHTISANDEDAWEDVPDHLDALLEAISCSCPNATSLEIFSLLKGEAHLAAPFFASLGHHLPHLLELRASSHPPNDDVVEVPGSTAQQWAACLPPGLRKLALPGMAIHGNMLQHLVTMPSLIELEAFSLCEYGARGPFPAVQSEACAWQVLRLHDLPAWGLINSFSTWPVGLKLEVSSPGAVEFEWGLEMPPSRQQALAVWEAAAKLSACIDSPRFPLSCLVLACRVESRMSPSEAATAVALIYALKPLDATLQGVRLKRWRVTAGVLQALTMYLPNTVMLGLEDCIVDSGAWQCLSVQPRLERLLFLGRTRTTLAQILVLAEGVKQGLEILVGMGCMTAADRAAVPSAAWSLLELRQFVDRPPVIIRRIGGIGTV